MNFRDRDELTALAGEYVLGVLPPEDRDDFEQELARNDELARAVAYWQDRLLEMAPQPDPVMPSPDLWSRIERDLPRAPAPARTTRPGFWNNLNFWRFTGVAGAAASIILAWSLLTTTPGGDGPRYVAVLQAPDKGASWLVETDTGTVRLTPLARTAVGNRQALQFWTKPEGAAGPTSLGLVPSDRPTVIPVSKLPGLGPNQLFEITLEPETGSPIGRPTGPILAVGKAVRL